MLELPEKLEHLRETITATLRSTNVLHYTATSTKPWESKLGGCPYLTSESDYPRDEYGEPMLFLAQINLSEMPPLPSFPTKGLLQFYIVNDEFYGLEQPCKVIYLEHYETDEEKLLRENPYQRRIRKHLPFKKECRITFESTVMPPTTDEPLFAELRRELDREERKALTAFCEGSGSRVGGYPYFIQGPVWVYESGEKRILLLQLDCDDESGLMFGDGGNCQFLIAEEDLKNKDFSDVAYDWACD